MDINDLTLGEVKEINNLVSHSAFENNNYKYIKGQKICIRGVTMIYTGIVEEDLNDAVVLSSACWIADTGRWSEFLKNPEKNVSESEMYPENTKIPIFKGIITDSCIISHVVLETI